MPEQTEGETPSESNIATPEKGFYPAVDYGNEFTSFIMGIRLLDRDGSNVSDMLKEGLRETRTFTEYNDQTHRQSLEDMARPEVGQLDEVAMRLRALGDSPGPIEEIREQIIRLVARGHGIIGGGQREQEILKEFGYEEEPTGPTT